MSKVKALSAEFKPKTVPIVDSNNSALLDSLQYPIYICAYPKGIKVLIRSGHMRLENGEIVRNMELKNKLSKLLEKSRRIKVTLECVISTTPGVSTEETFVYDTLREMSSSVEDLNCTIVDMVFEHSPETLDFGARLYSLKALFRPEEIGNFPKVINFVLATSKKEFENLILVYNVLDSCNEFIVASPKSRYKFGDIEELFSDNGGIAKINTKLLFSGKVLSIEPKVCNIRGKDTYIARSIKVQYKDTTLEIEIDSKSIIMGAKIWENKGSLIGQNALFSGTLIPGYSYPKYRSFVRFEKLK